ncbi:MAG: DUF3429 domain-containing protein [Alphaproteobacteria bacterium]|nr:MAG: DUF3429 domain-containing protein [Alphaproteobacteria bacterium]
MTLAADDAAPAQSRMLWILGLGGLIPFIVMTALLAYAGTEFIAFDMLIKALSGYGAVILSFLGGIRWGASLMRASRGRLTLGLSVLPSLFAWICLFLPAPWLFAALAVGFLAQGAWDVTAIQRGKLPLAFRTLRIVLTAVVVLCMIVAFFSTY